MSEESDYAVFVQHEDGALVRAFFSDRKEAESAAERFANEEGRESFVFDVKRFMIISTAKPQRTK